MSQPVALVAGERFGVMRDAFIAAGVPAISCDLVDMHAPGPHIVGDWLDVIQSRRWKVIVTHYTCTALSVSGNWVYAEGKPRHDERQKAISEASGLWWLARQRADIVVFENPRGVLSTQSDMGRWHDTVQPYEFGDDASKQTDLWLSGIGPIPRDPLQRAPGRVVEWPKGSGRTVERWGNQTDSGQNRLGPSEARAMERAKTYPGIANALAQHIARALAMTPA